jgi:hypothetical protein
MIYLIFEQMDVFVENIENNPVNLGGCGFFIVSKTFATNVTHPLNQIFKNN